jgi:hypothetical protein
MEIIKEALTKWGEAMQVRFENRTLFYSPVLKRWRVKKWSGSDARKFIYDGDNFQEAFNTLIGNHSTNQNQFDQF